MANVTSLNESGVAIQGYDPVSYFSGQPTPGSPDITASHDGATYYFATPDNKAKFEAAPEQYIPQYGGFCAVAVSEGKLVPVDPETYKITDDKLYLFYNGEFGNTKPQWEADEATLKASANKEWASLEVKPPLPPFTLETAKAKVQAAEDAWNTRNPEKVSLAYTKDSAWRNRSEFFSGRDKIREFLTRKWNTELDYRLKKELWSFTDNRISVKFEYEYHTDSGQWYRAYGNEQWEFAPNGLMQRREASINDVPIQESDRKFHWERN
ncbi:hypothetical protein C7B76_19485 [filamentous cyanobacterium CCP2]|nr:hypothetical protein C7B76_19485 [filamentous cyanobacterium CCP2]